MDKYIGFDIDDKKVCACVVEMGKADFHATIASDVGAMRRFLISQRRAGCNLHLAYEVSGASGYIYDQLSPCVDRIAVCNPVKATWIFRTAKKTDRIDARKLAVLLSIGELPTVYVPCREVRQWRQMILHRRNIVREICSIKNRIKALFKSVGIAHAFHKGSWWKAANIEWMKSNACGGEFWQIQLGSLLCEYDCFWGQLEKVTATLDAYLEKQPGGKLLMSIPGIGPRTAEAVLAYTDDVERFSSSKEYCSYFGVVPKIDQSGDMKRIGHITKHGPSVVRWLMCEAAWKSVRKSAALKAYYERVAGGDARRKKIAIVAVCRKILSIMRAMLSSGELYNEELAGRHCREFKAA